MYIQGYFETKTETYINGIVPKIYLKWLNEKHDGQNWLIADGPIDSSWTDDFNSVIDDNLKLTL